MASETVPQRIQRLMSSVKGITKFTIDELTGKCEINVTELSAELFQGLEQLNLYVDLTMDKIETCPCYCCKSNRKDLCKRPYEIELYNHIFNKTESATYPLWKIIMIPKDPELIAIMTTKTF